MPSPRFTFIENKTLPSFLQFLLINIKALLKRQLILDEMKIREELANNQ